MGCSETWDINPVPERKFDWKAAKPWIVLGIATFLVISIPIIVIVNNSEQDEIDEAKLVETLTCSPELYTGKYMVYQGDKYRVERNIQKGCDDTTLIEYKAGKTYLWVGNLFFIWIGVFYYCLFWDIVISNE